MNKETRTFIWGLIVFFCCLEGFVKFSDKIITSQIINVYWIGAGLCIVGAISGITKIYKSID